MLCRNIKSIPTAPLWFEVECTIHPISYFIAMAAQLIEIYLSAALKDKQKNPCG